MFSKDTTQKQSSVRGSGSLVNFFQDVLENTDKVTGMMRRRNTINHTTDKVAGMMRRRNTINRTNKVENINIHYSPNNERKRAARRNTFHDRLFSIKNIISSTWKSETQPLSDRSSTLDVKSDDLSLVGLTTCTEERAIRIFNISSTSKARSMSRFNDEDSTKNDDFSSEYMEDNDAFRERLQVEEEEDDDEMKRDDAIALGKRLILCSESSTTTSNQLFHKSNHVMVNQERIDRNIHLLVRNHDLDNLARSIANKIAETKDLVVFDHCSPEWIDHHNVGEEHLKMDFVVNVAKGRRIKEIHRHMMETDVHRLNILNENYTEMGMAVVRGIHGDQLILCQVYRGGVLSC